MIEAFLNGLRRWSDFRGRSTRSEFWFFALSAFLLNLTAAIITTNLEFIIGDFSDVLFAVFALCVYVPLLAVSVRRLHDTGKSGWYLLLIAIPLIGFIMMIVLMTQETLPYDNKWPPIPGEEDDDDLVNSLVGDNE